MRPPINSTKHYVPRSKTGIAMGAIEHFSPVQAVALSAVNQAQEVRAGAVIKAVWIEIWGGSQGTNGTTDQFVLAIEKKPAGATDMTVGDSLALNAYLNKKNVLYVTQGILGDNGTNTTPLFKGWVKIPKGKQRFGLGDEFVVNISTVNEALEVCGMAAYKEYF